MKFEELLRKAEAEGETRGEARGEVRGTTKMLELIRCMSENGEADQIPRLTEDEEFRTEMLQKYHLNI